MQVTRYPNDDGMIMLKDSEGRKMLIRFDEHRDRIVLTPEARNGQLVLTSGRHGEIFVNLK